MARVPQRRSGTVAILTSVIIFVVLLAVINPLGDFLIAHGLPMPVLAVILTVVTLGLVGVPFLIVLRGRTGRSRELVAAQAPAVEQWVKAAGWQPASWGDEPPAVLQRARVRSSTPLAVAGGQLAGRPAWVMTWDQRFANRGSVIEDRMVSLVVVVDGLPPEASFGMGKVGGQGALGRMPSRWAGLPPLGLVRVAPTHPWGLTRTMVWPGHGVGEPQHWAEIAAELDSLQGWLLIHQGRLEISTRLWDAPVPPERLFALATRAIGLVA